MSLERVVLTKDVGKRKAGTKGRVVKEMNATEFNGKYIPPMLLVEFYDQHLPQQRVLFEDEVKPDEIHS